MSKDIRADARKIIDESIKAVLPEMAVEKALSDKAFKTASNIIVIAIGKAAWNMAAATKEILNIKSGVVITKYGHSRGPIEGFEIMEAGHPIPDHNSIVATERAIRGVSGLSATDEVIFLISGGGSALFEKPAAGVTLEDIMDVTSQLLAAGADIIEINTIRKRLSAVKGGRFAKLCEPAHINAIVLSDVIGDRLDTIASGPACADSTTSADALKIADRYKLRLDAAMLEALKSETPKRVKNCDSVITGSVTSLCESAAQQAVALGYAPYIITTSLECEAREAGKLLGAIARDTGGAFKPPCAIIMGGETTVRLTGIGKGGRNQELALSAALEIEGLADTVIFSAGSDGTDGPTDAAGGIVDGGSAARMRDSGIDPRAYLDNNDSYNALSLSGDLIITGPTGTNVNDLMVALRI